MVGVGDPAGGGRGGGARGLVVLAGPQRAAVRPVRDRQRARAVGDRDRVLPRPERVDGAQDAAGGRADGAG